jgi:hypothetical protein
MDGSCFRRFRRFKKGSRVQGSGFRVQGSGFRVQGSRVHEPREPPEPLID